MASHSLLGLFLQEQLPTVNVIFFGGDGELGSLMRNYLKIRVRQTRSRLRMAPGIDYHMLVKAPLHVLIEVECNNDTQSMKQTALSTACPGIIQNHNVSKQDLVTMKHNINTLDPDTVYWVSVAAVSQYGKGYTADLNVTTLHEGEINVSSHSESNSMTTIIIVSIACSTLMVIALLAAGTVIIIKRKRASRCKSDTDAGSTYMDLPCKTDENHYDTLAVTSIN
ncbi:hypothetical protein CHS0354_016770 [Potamilus streckersoni]|uniref:Fibronectin type-III domain-containing protein n=1 Tax=Potamilus streckersoni TaxID=2493646 RepID=A0AAE0T4A4_9BIVA|nr:hypothetical protein CHS0354_016770 [Potamilus streckersoni]